MDNRTIHVIVNPFPSDDTKCHYSWYEEGRQPISFARNRNGTFRTLLHDIYKDRILLENIIIHPSLLEEFKAFESSHREQIELLKQEHPTIFTQANFCFAPSSVNFGF